MARRIRSSDLDSVPSNIYVWEDEARLPESDRDSEYSNFHDEPVDTALGSGQIVILTGASGFLGRNILQGLLSSSTVSEVHCMAVRSRESMEKLNNMGSSKIIVHSGDLTLPRLGLDITTARSLASIVNIIIHNGADVSFLKSYSSLKKANVGSTAELIRLARPRHIPIHFISSAGVAGFVPHSELPLREVSVAAYPPSTDPSAHGYQITKWVSERLLEKANQQYGLEIVLHRPTGIVGEQAPEADIIGNLLRYSRQLSLAPDMDGWDGYLDLVDVEVVAQRVLALLDPSSFAETRTAAIRVIHSCNPRNFPVGELGKHLEKLQGNKVGILPMNEWIGLAMQAGMNEMVAMYLQEVSSKRLGSYPPVVSDFAT